MSNSVKCNLFLKLGGTNPSAYYKRLFTLSLIPIATGPQSHVSAPLKVSEDTAGWGVAAVCGVGSGGATAGCTVPPPKPEGFPSVSAGCELLLARSREMTAELSQVACTKAPPPSKVLMLRNGEQRIRTRRPPSTASGVQGESSRPTSAAVVTGGCEQAGDVFLG